MINLKSTTKNNFFWVHKQVMFVKKNNPVYSRYQGHTAVQVQQIIAAFGHHCQSRDIFRLTYFEHHAVPHLSSAYKNVQYRE